MDAFLGGWTLESSEQMDAFLTYYGLSFLKRKVALISSVDLAFEKTSHNAMKRTIDSTFMQTEELYTFDGRFHANDAGFNKKHCFASTGIKTEVKNSSLGWSEVISLENDKLVVRRKWFDNATNHTCEQIFARK